MQAGREGEERERRERERALVLTTLLTAEGVRTYASSAKMRREAVEGCAVNRRGGKGEGGRGRCAMRGKRRECGGVERTGRGAGGEQTSASRKQRVLGMRMRCVAGGKKNSGRALLVEEATEEGNVSRRTRLGERGTTYTFFASSKILSTSAVFFFVASSSCSDTNHQHPFRESRQH